jgi:GNAT superfamily N-acetyltransferase
MSKSGDALTIRLARVAERDVLEALQRRASLHSPEYREQLEANPDAIYLPREQIKSNAVIVAEVDGRMGGFAAMIGGEIDGLFVEPALWRKGIGSALVEAVAARARREGVGLSVIASEAARPCYESCGFSVDGVEQTRFGPALRMSR